MATPINPISRFKRWFEQARRAGIPLPEAMALGTAERYGRVFVRYVLLKDCSEAGFVFYTNMMSAKGRQLSRNPRAALAFYWDKIGKQVRIEGAVTEVGPEEADAYWQTRPRGHRLAAIASQQTRPLAGRGRLLARMKAVERKFAGSDIPRPANWSGFRVAPELIEFWTMRPNRLHERECFTRRRGGWRRVLLQP